MHKVNKFEYTEELRADLSMISDGNRVICGLPNPIPSGEKEYDELELRLMRKDAELICSAKSFYNLLKDMCDSAEKMSCWDKMPNDAYYKAKFFLNEYENKIKEIENGKSNSSQR